MKKRLLSLFLALAMVLGMLPVSAFAEERKDGEDVTVYENFAVTEPEISGGVYQAGTADELMWLSNYVNEGNNNVSVKLTQDIDLENQHWIPIGNSSLKPYSGIFDGNGKCISGLHINDSTLSDRFGLFGTVGENAKVLNVTVSGEIEVDKGNVGGIAGFLENSGEIINCHGNIDISCKNNAGGIVGMSKGTVKGCSNTTKINTSGANAGGIVGSNATGGIIESCFNKGEIKAGTNASGGIAGSNLSTISNSYNSGFINAKTMNAGGIAGQNSLSIINVYNIGSVTGGKQVGGIIGNRTGNNGEITNAFFLDNVSSGIGNGSGTTYKKTSQELKADDIVELLGEQFLKDDRNINDSYPILKWQASGDDSESDIPFINGVLQIIREDDTKPVYPGETLYAFYDEGNCDDKYLRYQWIRIKEKNETNIDNSDNYKYTVSDKDVGCSLKVKVSSTSPSAIIGYLESETTPKIELEVKEMSISDAEDLAAFMNALSKDNHEIYGRLTSDIDLKSQEWVGVDTGNKAYKWVLDGNNFSIKGLYINKVEFSGGSNHGLFSVVGNTGTVKNLIVEGSISAYQNCGGISGKNKGTIENCTNRADIKCESSGVGGIAGSNYANIVDCINRGRISAVNSANASMAGGIAGGNDSEDSIIEGSFNTGDVTGSRKFTGGITGYNQGEVTNIYNTGLIIGNGEAGGISGGQASSSQIKNAYSTGIVENVTEDGAKAIAGNDRGILGNLYYRNDLPADGQAETKGTEEMKLRGFSDALGEGFAYDELKINNGYPVLKWQGIDTKSYGEIDGSVKITGENVVGGLINAKYTGSADAGSIQYLWLKEKNSKTSLLSYGQADTYELTAESAGFNILVKVVSNEKSGYISAKLSDATEGLTGSVTVEGVPKTGEKLTADYHGNSNNVYYTWLRSIDGKEIEIATDVIGEYVISHEDIGARIKVKVASPELEGYVESGYTDVIKETITGGWDNELKEPFLKDNFYQIGTPQELAWFSHEINTNNAGINGKLTDNIDLQDKQWVPIGTENSQFSGTFSGMGYNVTGLKIERNDADYQGMFGYMGKKGIVKHVNVKGSINISSPRNSAFYTGGIAGWNDGQIYNCTFAGSVSGYSHVGGIAGGNGKSADISIKKCLNSASVKGVLGSIGGITGSNAGAVYESVNIGEVYGDESSSGVGGIAGVTYDYTTIEDCYNSGKVFSDKYSSQTGGIAGASYESFVNGCYNIGDVIGNKNIGAVFGESVKANVQLGRNYYLNSLPYDYNAERLTEEYMKGADFLNKLRKSRFMEDKNNINNGFPVLIWQVVPVDTDDDLDPEKPHDSAKINIVATREDKILYSMNNITVSDFDISEYGFENNNPGQGPTLLHALIKINESMFNLSDKRKVNDYLSVESNGFINKSFGIENGEGGFYFSYLVNNVSVNTSAGETILNDGDTVQVFLYDYENGTSVTCFDKSAAVLKPGEDLELCLKTVKTHIAGYEQPVSEARIVTSQGNNITETEWITDSEGKVDISFNDEGVYLISAVKYVNGKSLIVMPWCRAEVKEDKTLQDEIENASKNLTWNIIKGKNSSKENVINDLNLKSSYNETGRTTIIWESSDESIVKNDGSVIRQEDKDCKVVLKGKICFDESVDSSGYEPYIFEITLYVPKINNAGNLDIYEIMKNIASEFTEKTGEWIIMDMALFEKMNPEANITSSASAIKICINNMIESLNSKNADANTYAKAVIILKSLGYDARKITTEDGRNIDAIEILSSLKEADQYSIPWILLAYQQDEYNVDEGTEERLIYNILQEQKDNGIWGYEWNGTVFADVDTTGIVISSLSKYYHDDTNKYHDKVKEAVDKAIYQMSLVQSTDGSYSQNANSTAMAIIGLASVGINPEKDSRFVKNGNTLLDGLLSQANEDNTGFIYDGKYNELATEQGFRALMAAYGILSGKQSINIYDFSGNSSKPVVYDNSSESEPEKPDDTEQKDKITVYFELRDDKHTIIKNTSVMISKGSSVKNVFIKVLDENNIKYEINGGSYVSSINGLSEKEHGNNSGWMYKVNGIEPTVGFNDFTLSENDRILWYYVNDYTQEDAYKKWSNASPGTGVLEYPNERKSMFADVKTDDWFFEAVNYVVQNELFAGVSATEFSPNSVMTRAMLVTVLYRMDGKPTVAVENTFTDVDDGQWYTDAVTWANAGGIVTGYGERIFGTNDPVTREQMAVILYRYVQMKGCDITKGTDLTSYDDYSSVSPWAELAMKWAVSQGLIVGTSSTKLSPSGTTTRAQVATILMRYIQNVK